MIKSPLNYKQSLQGRQFYIFAAFLAVLTFLFYSAPELLAQEADADADDTVAKKTMLDNVTDAGIWMLPLLLASVAMVALIVYNFIQLTESKFNPPDLKASLHDHMANCRVRSAIEVASTSPTYLGMMVAAALPNVDATDADSLGREDVEDAIAEFTVKQNSDRLTWIGYLGIIGQIAPMLGLLGTVVGMMGAFNTLASQGQADPSVLAGDIGLAMVTTASGLIIAIPSIFFFFFLRNKLNGLVASCHNDLSEMLDASYQAVNADQAMAKVPEGFQS
ncbi:MAG TPA: MotA/TolQ/ExbB proton channel family protein [Verrucomicrobia bacterium]|nr:MotA/TolQ/ExbB proton channel family protein [Verrucomicrobiales bacterium]HIL54664.1 MotA/TolQ/ExbB proton channel family protein [Verrucomicrobiota bacterium]